MQVTEGCCDAFMLAMLMLPLLLTMRMALVTTTLLWLLGLLIDIYTAKPPPLGSPSSRDDTTTVSRESGAVSTVSETQKSAHAIAEGQTVPREG